MNPTPLMQPESWNLVAAAYAAEAVPTMFAHFAAAALRLAGLPEGARVADVACGPGSLALLAAPRASHVAAIDFSPAMIAELRALAPDNVEARVGDGHHLPWPDASFDRAFSMFGLVFFADRARGFAELLRVLVPGGRAVVSSWPPADKAPVIGALFKIIAAESAKHGKPTPPPGPPPLGTPELVRAEMTAAGFVDVAVEEVPHEVRFDSLDDMWSTMVRTNVILALQRQRHGDAWATEEPRLRRALEEALGPPPYVAATPALLGIGTKPGG